MKNKVKTGLLLTLFLIYCIALQYLSNYIFDAFIVLVGVIAVNEFANMQTKSGYPGYKFSAEGIFILMFLALILGVIFGLSAINILFIEFAILGLSYLFIFGLSALVFKKKVEKDEFRKITNMSTTEFSFFKTNNSFMSVLYPAVFFIFLGFLNHIQNLGFTTFNENTSGVPMGLFGVVLLFAICSLTDTFAMIFGTLIGGKKLCPSISPKKTISGAVSGIVGGTIGSIASYLIFSAIFKTAFATIYFWQFLIIGLVVSAIAEVGDLFESYSKRRANVKDSGDFFRSHGGVLDRLDSIVFNIPVIFISLLFIFG
ncbi:MAG: CDP-archaeol synthase [Clostridia bacterium]|nr:CDP-archaeol synthase [Clostridia bacterium]